MKRVLILVVVLSSVTLSGCKKFDNCDALSVEHPHGVALPGAVDFVRDETPAVTDFRVDEVLYKFNTHLDRDDDKIACERP